MKHIINILDFEGQKVEHILASSAGQGHSKRLVATINLNNNDISYEVIKDGIVDYTTSILPRAIEQYNELE